VVRKLTGRQVWGPFCDHWSAHPPMATWYSECKRLRVSYWVERGVVRLYSARGSRWVLEDTMCIPGMTEWSKPETMRQYAYAWLAAEAGLRFPEKPAAVVNPVGCRATKPPKTVRR